MTMNSTTKTRKIQARSITLILPMNEQGMNGIIRIVQGSKVEEYFLDRIGSDFGDAYFLDKYSAGMEEDGRYQVCLNGQHSTSECNGFLRHGHCKHLAGLQALKVAGKL